jgi:hypothetical protein
MFPFYLLKDKGRMNKTVWEKRGDDEEKKETIM